MSRLSRDDCRGLLTLARQAISSAILESRVLDLPAASGALGAPAGAFVTLHCMSRLRGCVGQVESTDPLTETVARAAINAALHDSRFHPVEPEEVQHLEIEISVLSPLQPISLEAIIVGRHGLVVARGERRGLLLPQVAAEREWSSQRFLEETCAKAGLPRDAWRDSSVRILGFDAEVFSDAEFLAISG